MPALDLATAVLFTGITRDGSTLLADPAGDGGEFTIPAAHIADPTSHYAVTVTYDSMPATGGFVYLYSIPSPDSTGYSTGYWYWFGSQAGASASNTGVGGEPGTGSCTIYLGPGVADWSLVFGPTGVDERYLLVNVAAGVRVTGMSFDPVTLTTSEPVQTPDVIQDERAQYNLVTDVDSTYGSDEAQHEVAAPGDHELFTQAAMQGAMADAATRNDGQGSHGVLTTVANYVTVNYTYGPGGVVDGVRISHLDAQHAFNPSVVRARYDFAPTSRPAGAIGYVWESGRLSESDWAQPVSATLLADESTARLVNLDDTADAADMPSGPENVWRPNSQTDVFLTPVSLDPVTGELAELPSPTGDKLWTLEYADGDMWVGPDAPVGDLPASALGATDRDLTAFISDGGREDRSTQWVIFTATTTVTPRGEGLDRPISLGEGTHLTAQVGAGLLDSDNLGGIRSGVVIRWTYTPPTFRWIYPDPAPDEAEPYRRIFPRGDRLGAGSARTFPRPRSVQASNRTFGGYI